MIPDSFMGQLLLNSQNEFPQDVMVSFDNLGVSIWLFSSCLYVPSVHPLGGFFAHQTGLLISDKYTHGTMWTNPLFRDGRNNRDGGLIRERRCHRPSDRLVDKMRNHLVLVEQNIPLDDFVESSRQSGARNAAVAGFGPHSAYTASVYNVFDHVSCLGWSAGVLK